MPIRRDLLTDQGGPPVTQHRKMPELVARIGLRQRLGTLGEAVAREKVCGLRHQGAVIRPWCRRCRMGGCTGIGAGAGIGRSGVFCRQQPQLAGQGLVEEQNLGPGEAGGLSVREEGLGQRAIAVGQVPVQGRGFHAGGEGLASTFNGNTSPSDGALPWKRPDTTRSGPRGLCRCCRLSFLWSGRACAVWSGSDRRSDAGSGSRLGDEDLGKYVQGTVRKVQQEGIACRPKTGLI